MIFADNYKYILNKIEQCAADAKREKTEIQILAVSKRHSAAAIEEAYHAGVRDFGENYIQELVEKQAQLKHLTDIRWHLIGHIQSNKVKFLENIFAIHSIDSLALAKKVCDSEKLKSTRVYIQLEIDREDENKFGCVYQDALAIANYLRTSENTHWVGFMGMGPAETESEKLTKLYEKFVQQGKEIWALEHSDSSTPHFSLGMSGDLKEAIAAGTNLVRVGTALFGARD